MEREILFDTMKQRTHYNNNKGASIFILGEGRSGPSPIFSSDAMEGNIYSYGIDFQKALQEWAKRRSVGLVLALKSNEIPGEEIYKRKEIHNDDNIIQDSRTWDLTSLILPMEEIVHKAAGSSEPANIIGVFPFNTTMTHWIQKTSWDR